VVVAPAQQRRTIVDRVVASLDGAAVTQSEVEQEYKLELFLEEGRVPDRVPDNKTFDAVLNRLIDQRLLADQLEAAGLAKLDVRTAVTERVGETRRRLQTEQAFRAALRSLGMDENGLRAKLEMQLRILQMTDRRLRPDAKPSQSEIEAYYRTTFLPEFIRRGNGSPPPLPEVEDRIVDILVQKKIGELLEAWLKELRSAHHIKVLSGSS
jgi:hypothetical protein